MTDVIQEIDQIVSKARMAADTMKNFTQYQVDGIAGAMCSAGVATERYLAEMAVGETGIGKAEDKVVKNHFGSQVVYDYMKDKKSVGPEDYLSHEKLSPVIGYLLVDSKDAAILCDQFQISPDYIINDINVIFLDNSPVDDLDAAIIKEGGVLALSAAMPGLVGAAMRRDGLSWMRASISYRENESEQGKQDGIVEYKTVQPGHGRPGGVFPEAGRLR